jgi:hypothetical protein
VAQRRPAYGFRFNFIRTFHLMIELFNLDSKGYMRISLAVFP